MNSFSILLDSIVNCIQVCMNNYQKIPILINYTPNNSVYIGNDLSITLGITNGKKEVTLHLNDENHALLVAGVSGSGKSNFINLAICQLLSYQNIELYLIDPKIVELGQYSNIMQCISFASDEDDITNLLNNILANIKDDYKKLLVNNKVKVKSYERAKVVIVEELALLNKKQLALLSRIVAIARGVGYRFIVSIQRADSNLMSSSLKSLLTNRIAFRCTNKANSQLIIENDLASEIQNRGRCYVLENGKITEVQSYFINEKTIIETVNKNLKPKAKNIDSGTKCDSDWLNKF